MKCVKISRLLQLFCYVLSWVDWKNEFKLHFENYKLLKSASCPTTSTLLKLLTYTLAAEIKRKISFGLHISSFNKLSHLFIYLSLSFSAVQCTYVYWLSLSLSIPISCPLLSSSPVHAIWAPGVIPTYVMFVLFITLWLFGGTYSYGS